MKALQKLTAWGLLLNLPALLGGCWGPCKSRPLSADQRAYFMDFKPGDYWIYRNVANGDIDSVYFVSQKITSENSTPSCIDEYASIQLKGFAKSLTYSYVIQGWDQNISIDMGSTIDYKSGYNFTQVKPQIIGKKNYSQAFSITHCCLEGCSQLCDGTYMRFDRLVFAKSVGIVRWEAIRHPKFRTVTYELIRSNRL